MWFQTKIDLIDNPQLLIVYFNIYEFFKNVEWLTNKFKYN